MNTLRRPPRVAALLAVLLVLALDLAGQTVAVRAVIAAPKSGVRISGVTERVDGVWAGVALDFQAGRFTLSGSGTRGRLTPSQTGAVPKRDVGEMSLGGHYDFRPWLRFDLRYAARAFSSAAGYQRWDMLSVGATTSRDLGTRAVRACAGLAYVPVVTVSGQQRPTFALSSDVGIVLLPTHLPIGLRLDYRIERFNFPTASGRSEQFEAFTFSMGSALQRVGGRWKVGAPGE